MNEIMSLGIFIADKIFGNKITNDENLFLTNILDETDPDIAKLITKLNHCYNDLGLKNADNFVIQVIGRTGGFVPDKKCPLGKYVSCFNLTETQFIKKNKDIKCIKEFSITEIYDCKDGYPYVPMKTTRINNFLKKRNYINILIWVFWESDPIKL